jgi:CRP/FNR family transcriptional regulator
MFMYSQSTASPAGGATARPKLKDLFDGQRPEAFSPGEAIFWEGDEARQIFDVLEGVLRMCKVLPDGRRAIVGFIYPGEMLGLSFHDHYLFTAEAVIDVKVRRIPRVRFFALVNESPVVQPLLIAHLCDEMSAAQDQMLLLGRKSAEERVVSFLLAVHRKSAIDDHIVLPMSRLDMADYLGLTAETVSRTMTSLCRRGLIRTVRRGGVALRKRAALGEIADGAAEAAVSRRALVRRAVWPD